jgi:polar amino acid transport system substrate-binding protein
LPDVQAGRWDMNVPIFVTTERAMDVAFNMPVWSLGDGFVVHRSNPTTLTSYESVAMHGWGLFPGKCCSMPQNQRA